LVSVSTESGTTPKTRVSESTAKLAASVPDSPALAVPEQAERPRARAAAASRAKALVLVREIMTAFQAGVVNRTTITLPPRSQDVYRSQVPFMRCSLKYWKREQSVSGRSGILRDATGTK
jgi:hypothetical protein